MNDKTRKLYSQMCLDMCETYSVATVENKFAVVPEVEQKLQDAIVEQATFLQKINVLSVTAQKGQNLLGSASGPASGRTDTSADGKERSPKELLSLDALSYECHKTNSDLALKYDTMDAWAHIGDLDVRYPKWMQQRIAADRITIGWHGETVAADTNLTTYPLMQDVNKGWFQVMREKKPENVISSGAVVDQVRIGAGGDFVNLDHAVSDLLSGIPEHLHDGLVAYVGTELVGMEKSALYKAIGSTPTEKNEATESLKSFGGLPYETPSFFPARGIMITSPDNLSIYVQTGTWRRNLVEEPKKDQVADYNSRNEAYVVENPNKCICVEFKNVRVSDGAGGWE